MHILTSPRERRQYGEATSKYINIHNYTARNTSRIFTCQYPPPHHHCQPHCHLPYFAQIVIPDSQCSVPNHLISTYLLLQICWTIYFEGFEFVVLVYWSRLIPYSPPVVAVAPFYILGAAIYICWVFLCFTATVVLMFTGHDQMIKYRAMRCVL